MSNLGQMTSNDCWISATILCFYMGLYHIPSIKIDGLKVTFPDGKIIILKENPCCEIETVIRASRVYFSEINTATTMRTEKKDGTTGANGDLTGTSSISYFQKYLDLSKLNKTGNPDTISKLFFRLSFKIYSTSFISFYPKINIKNIENMLLDRNPKEVFMFTFKFNPNHLYVYHDIFEDGMMSVFDVSELEIKQTNISTSNISILFRIDLSSIEDI